MKESSLRARTPFNDFTGTCAIDESEDLTFLEFIKEHGVNLDQYLPVALGIHRERESEQIFVYVVDKRKVATSYEEIQTYLDSTGGPLPVQQIDLKVTFSQVFTFMARFAMIIPIKKSLTSFEIKQDEGFVFWD